MRPFYPNGYETCIHSRKRKNAAWKVHDSCPNPSRQPSFKGYQLPYKTICLTCPFYKPDSKADKKD